MLHACYIEQLWDMDLDDYASRSLPAAVSRRSCFASDVLQIWLQALDINA